MARFFPLLMLSSLLMCACTTPYNSASHIGSIKTFSGMVRVLDRSYFVAVDGAVFDFELMDDSSRKAYAKAIGGGGYIEEVCASIVFSGRDTGRKDDAGRSILAIQSIEKISRIQCAD